MSVKIAAIIPTRGDRPKLLKIALSHMKRQTRRPDKVFLIDYEPKNSGYDLTARIKRGYDLAKGYDLVFIIEDDDYYPANYIEKMTSLFKRHEPDIIGISQTTYYNIFENTYMEIDHPGRSSLFCTALRGGLKINWPSDNTIFLDIFLFKHIRNKYLVRSLARNPIGIKHGIGKTGGNAHRDGVLPKKDPKLFILKLIMDKKSIEDYEKFKQGNKRRLGQRN